MKEKQIILAARTISMVFTPFYLPLVGLAALFTFSYMSLLPWQYKTAILLTVYIFTILLPTLLIRIYRHYQGWTLSQLGIRERRMIPYIIAIVCYFACYYLMNSQRIPRFMSNILVAALVIQVVCAIINVWWKISILFTFNPLWWFCIILIIAGMVGSSRMILRQHSLSQVCTGFLVGAVISFYMII